MDDSILETAQSLGPVYNLHNKYKSNIVIGLCKYSIHPFLEGLLWGKKESTNSAFGKCFGDISVTQNCPEWNLTTSHLWGPVVHRQKNPPNLAEWAVCASWHLKNGWLLNFILGNFESQKYPENISQRPNWLIFFSLWAILPERGELAKPIYKTKCWLGLT